MIDKAFIVREHWGNLILDNLKPWEIRSTRTQVRGKVGVIFSGTGMIYGSVEILGSSILLKQDFEMFPEKHRIQGGFEDLPYKEPHIWQLGNAVRFKKPVPYKHPRGAVIWVNLEHQDQYQRMGLED